MEEFFDQLASRCRRGFSGGFGWLVLECAVEEGRLAGVAVAHSLGKYTDEDAVNRKMVIRSRLDQLRSGPFGEGRLQAVQELVNRVKHAIN